MSDHTLKVTSANFESDVIESDLPVVVDFWAPWCGPCRMIGPILENLAAEYAGQVRVAKINVDDEPELAGGFRIQGIPTLMFLWNGQIVGRVTGFPGEQPLKQAFDQLVELVDEESSDSPTREASA